MQAKTLHDVYGIHHAFYMEFVAVGHNLLGKTVPDKLK